MDIIELLVVGVAVGVTTVLFGFGGGFVTVPVITVVDAHLGAESIHVAVATSLLVMLVNAAVATASTSRDILRGLRASSALLALLALGGAAGALLARSAPSGLLRWGFVAYVAVTVVDLVLRPGFFGRPQGLSSVARPAAGGHAIPAALGLPIGAVASFLGVGGSVMTVPVMRRAGASMHAAAALANPLTIAIVGPACAVALLFPAGSPDTTGRVGGVDVRAAAALLTGALPTIVLLRRRPPRIPDAVHAYGYVALLVVAGASVAIAR